MKTHLTSPRRTRPAFAALALVLLLSLAGCLEQLYVWSPDGRRAAVIDASSRTLYLCEADGRLSPPLATDVFRVAWLGDSQRLLLARKHAESHWPALARAMGETRAAALAAQAEAAWQQLRAGKPWNGANGVAALFADRDLERTLVTIYLRDQQGDALQAKLNPGEWDEVTKATAEIHELVLARIDAEKLALGPPLYVGLDEIADLRVAPGDRTVAFTAEFRQGKTKDGRLWIVPLDAATPQLVAERVAAYPDWTADGRSLVFVQASGAGTSDDLRLGTLVQSTVLDATGKIHLPSEPRYLAGLMFSDQARVRCLRDGRILFNAAPISLPLAVDDFGDEREELFALDPARQATLVRLIPRKPLEQFPKGLTFFQVSPDEQHVLVGDINGNVCLLTLATGALQSIQAAVKGNVQGTPVWRTKDEFTYTRRAPSTDGPKPARAVEVVLRHGDDETVLSQSWPEAMVNALYSEKQ